jgi:predicted ABC-type transport system involved in lysophospholipase L1 biosynthesis ATPase subunit
MGEEIMRILEGFHARGLTIVLVTHDPSVAARAQRTLKMRDGRVVDAGEGAS